MYSKIDHCRICGNTELPRVLDLGEQMLTGVFPASRAQAVTVGPLRLVKCHGPAGSCGLLQLEHAYDADEMYGKHYGYRSGLNASMVEHLYRKVARIRGMVALAEGDLVVDIGSNDGTTLGAYPDAGLDLVGMDPSGAKFRQYYAPHVQLIPDFFSAAELTRHFPGRKARVVTSFSMFYDLADPIAFMRQVHDVLADDGIWVFEQSYMPTMLEMNAYDTVCHEHMEYYGLAQIKWMTDRVGFTIVDVEFNDVNGGSFSVTVSKSGLGRGESPDVARILEDEERAGLHGLAPYEAFADRARELKADLLGFLAAAAGKGETVAALGASTKGNVVLQYCGITPAQVPVVGEVNPEKFGCFTPATWIPIVPQDDVLASNPDYLLVLPWHFRRFFLAHPKLRGRKLLFPLPKLEVVVAGELA